MCPPESDDEEKGIKEISDRDIEATNGDGPLPPR
jgi:hypothetical protein